jgi:hypothetical protein
MSNCTKSAAPPASRTEAQVWSPPGASMSATRTRAPTAAIARAVARPIPDAPPVTTAIFRSSRIASPPPPRPSAAALGRPHAPPPEPTGDPQGSGPARIMNDPR